MVTIRMRSIRGTSGNSLVVVGRVDTLLIQIQFRENRADDWRVERVAIEGKWIIAF